MSFVRLKTIGSAHYAYLVENYWTPKGSRQKTSKYLGRVHRLDQTYTSLNSKELPTTYQDLIRVLLRGELIKRAFIETEEDTLVHPQSKIHVNLKEGTFIRQNKPIVIESHEGFICEHTFKELITFRAQTDRFEKELANTLLAAGIAVVPEQFITIYEAVKKKEERGS